MQLGFGSAKLECSWLHGSWIHPSCHFRNKVTYNTQQHYNLASFYQYLKPTGFPTSIRTR